MKIVFIICDGMGDRPIPELGNKTPLEYARTPNMDALAASGVCGNINILGKGHQPHSDDAHLTIFGYDLSKHYPGRGPIEAAGVGIKLQHGDIAMRSNLATVDEKLVVVDRRAGRIESTAAFVRQLDGMKIGNVRFIVKPGTGYRAIIVMRGKGISDQITSNDPEFAGKKALAIKPMDKSTEAKYTAEIMTEFLSRSHEILEKNPLNMKRKKKGELPANYILARGFGHYKKIPSFQEKYGLSACCIAGAGLYKGLGSVMGMDVLEVRGATGLPNTDVGAKFMAAKNALKKYDFIFVHVKPTDSLGEDGNVKGKTEFIEKIDNALGVLMGVDAALIITADHSTPCMDKAHSDDPVPILVYSKGIRPDNLKKFSEKDCSKGGLGTIMGKDVMKNVRKVLKF